MEIRAYARFEPILGRWVGLVAINGRTVWSARTSSELESGAVADALVIKHAIEDAILLDRESRDAAAQKAQAAYWNEVEREANELF